MNSDFYITLRKVKETRYDYDDALSHLEQDVVNIQMRLNKTIDKSSEWLKEYAEGIFNQITTERIRIKSYLVKWQNKDLEGLSAYDIGEIDEEITYFSGILNIIDDCRANTLEFLIGMYPADYQDQYYLNLVEELIPNTNHIKLKFVGQYPIADKIKPDQWEATYVLYYNNIPSGRKNEDFLGALLKLGYTKTSQIEKIYQHYNALSHLDQKHPIINPSNDPDHKKLNKKLGQLKRIKPLILANHLDELKIDICRINNYLKNSNQK